MKNDSKGFVFRMRRIKILINKPIFLLLLFIAFYFKTTEIQVLCIPYKDRFVTNGKIYLNQITDLETKTTIVYNSNMETGFVRVPKSAQFSNTVPLFFSSALIREARHFMHLKNAYVNSKAFPKGRFFNNVIVIDGKQLITADEMFFSNISVSSCTLYEHVIYLYSSHITYGHLIGDIIPQILNFPETLINKSVIFFSAKDRDTALKLLKIVNIPSDKIIIDDKWHFAKNLYLEKPVEIMNGLFTHTFPKFIDLIRKYTGVDSIKATRYAVSNRYPNSSSRYVRNIGELHSQLNVHIPRFNWELVDMEFENMNKTSREVASLKVWISPSGSNLENIIFMNRFTSGVLIICASQIDMANAGTAFIMKVWAMAITNKYNHYKPGGGDCDIQTCINCAIDLVYAVEHGKWNQTVFNYSKNIFNITEIQILVEKNGFMNPSQPIIHGT